MCMGEKLSGELWWTLNLVVHRMGDVLVSLMGVWNCVYTKLKV
jgi:hypothetical protein